MRFKVGDYFYYKFWHDYWIIGKIISIDDKCMHLGTKQVFFTTIKKSQESDGYYPIDRFQNGSLMYAEAKILNDGSDASLLAVTL